MTGGSHSCSYVTIETELAIICACVLLNYVSPHGLFLQNVAM